MEIAGRYDGLHTSVSQIETYRRCPRLFELRYGRGEAPAFVPAALALGSAVHEALASFYTWIADHAAWPRVTHLLESFDAALLRATAGPLPILEHVEAPPADLGRLGRTMLAAFFGCITKEPVPHVLAVEHGFLVDLYDPVTGAVLDIRLKGVFDLVLEEASRPRIVEHKTAARRYSREQLDHTIQLAAYRFAAIASGMDDPTLRFQIITKADKPAVQLEEVERGDAAVDDFLAIVGGVLRAIEAEAFYPVRSSMCKSCPFQEPCRQPPRSQR